MPYVVCGVAWFYSVDVSHPGLYRYMAHVGVRLVLIWIWTIYFSTVGEILFIAF